MALRLFLTFSLLALIDGGCDRGTPAPTTDDSGPTRLLVEVTPIVPLLPRLKTHVALDSHANLYWQQESQAVSESATGDLVFVMGDSGVPQALTELTVPNLLAAAGQPRGSGAIRSMAVGPGGKLYVLFTGGSGRSPLAFVALYTPSTRKVSIIADTARLMKETGMGPSIDLARGSLVNYGENLWLWFRHTDAGVILRMSESGGGKTGVNFHPVVPKNADPKHPLRLQSEREDLSAGPDLNLYYLDRIRATIWKIAADGAVEKVHSVEGLSGQLAAPSVDSHGNLYLVAGDGEKLFVHDGAESTFEWTQLEYPAFVRLATDGKVDTIARDGFVAPQNLSIQNVQPRELLFDPSNGTFVTFDAASGELLRLNIARK